MMEQTHLLSSECGVLQKHAGVVPQSQFILVPPAPTQMHRAFEGGHPHRPPAFLLVFEGPLPCSSDSLKIGL